MIRRKERERGRDREREQWRIQGGFMVARKPPPPGHDFFYNQVGDTLTDTYLHQPLQFATFGKPLRPTLYTPLERERECVRERERARAREGDTDT